MMNCRNRKHNGLVLLIVLGLLGLFSLLTVTYVVFASQSKSTNLAVSRRFVKEGSSSSRTLLDEAIKHLIRGSTNNASEMYGHSLLDDLYGANETASLATTNLSVRTVELLPPNPPITYAAASLQRPMLIGNRFLRFPIVSSGPIALPVENDVLNGRIVTFPASEGPLGGLSFHIVRYIGNVDSNVDGSNFSITIDLQENDLTRVHSQLVGTGSGNVSLTSSIAEWALRSPNSQPWAAGVYLCYRTINTGTGVLSDPYSFFINAVPLNGHGVGVLADGSSQIHALNTAFSGVMDPGIHAAPTGLQLRYNKLINDSARLFDPDLVASGANLWGDTDEPIDAADFNTPFLAFRPAGAQNSGDIIPSFHRTALLNYLVNFKPIEDYTELDFWAALRRIELAMLRPLSLDIRTPSGVPDFMDFSYVVSGAYVKNPQFNPTGAVAGNLGSGIAPLQINITGSWAGDWNPTGAAVFRQWLNGLMVGTWDVDNLASGIPDSVFIDIGLPLQDRDGKLLKTLVAYYVECMDGKLDVNAAGGSAQANMYSGNLFALPTAYAANDNAGAETPFARGNGAGNSIYLNQGLGYGPADTSLRHLFGKSGLAWDFNSNGSFTSGNDSAEMAYRGLMAQRYFSTLASPSPGVLGHDALSILNLRENREIHQHGALPGLPKGIRGRVSYAVDRLGNPFIHNESTGIMVHENEYEARLIAGANQDNPLTFAEWERIYRKGDSDRTGLPDRLQRIMGETDATLLTSSLSHEITARSRHLRVPKLHARDVNFKTPANQPIVPPRSFLELVNTIRRLKSSTELSFDQFRVLFPIEFHRGQALNLNRPFGDGIDNGNAVYAADGIDNNNNGLIDEPNEGDGQVDEPNEVAGGQWPLDVTGPTSVGVVSPADPLTQLQYSGGLPATNLDPSAGSTTGNESRQFYARHLYCLAQLLVPAEYNFPSIDRAYWQDLLRSARAGDANARQKYVQMRSGILAQWAVNVVDYRDSDSTMTRFPYDPDPFNTLGIAMPGIGWEPTRNLTISGTAPVHNPNIYVAWGMERAELLLTESLAFHDLRVRRDPTATPARYDQFRIPQGSLFLELYNPRTTAIGSGAGNSTMVPGVSPSLYTTNGSGDIVLNLSKLSPADGSGNTFPVWRIYLSGSIDKTASGMDQTHKTPNERLIEAALNPADNNNRLEPIRHDLTYQLPASNRIYDPTYSTSSNSPEPLPLTVNVRNGLHYDVPLREQDRIRCLPDVNSPEVDPNTARVILFTNGFAATNDNTPGITDPAGQVFYNRNGSNLLLHGNQYMVIGPRDVTNLGSLESAPTAAMGGYPGNRPSDHRIFLSGNWAQMFNRLDQQFRPAGSNVRDAVTMIAAANRPSTWVASPPAPFLPHIGINVSEPLPKASGYYNEPTSQVNTNNHPTNGFHSIAPDGYYDYGAGGTAPELAPFDDGTAGPLANWTNYTDGSGAALKTETIGTSPNDVEVVVPGTAIDWSTAYLQRLADPDRPWHATFNPYITVDWLPIDLTVFSGEEADSIFTTGVSEMRLASRQKSGQMVDPVDLSFHHDSMNGLSFHSPLTHMPRQTNVDATALTFLKHDIKGEVNDTDGTTDPRPSICDSDFKADNTQSFATLGYLNSTYVLAAESGIANLAALPPVFVGAPGNPDNAAPLNERLTWHPASIFWADRTFVNGFEIAYVPVSGPAQLGQEFSATSTSTTSMFSGIYHKPTTSGTVPYPQDPRMPTTIFSSTDSTAMPGVTAGDWGAGNGLWPYWIQPSQPSPAEIDAEVNSTAHYPFTHLLNFFQEPVELYQAEQRYRSLGGLHRYTHRHPKDTSLSLLFDMIDTPSAWADVENHEQSGTFRERDPSLFTPENATLVNASNRIFTPFRAPYNQLQRDVEPGRVQLNTISEQNVLQGLWSNVSRPGDVDFPAYGAPLQPNDIDHNQNTLFEAGGRIQPNQIGTVWTAFVRSRQGYDPVTLPGLYTPPNQSLLNPALPTRSFNPLYPTHFAGLFKPAAEAGMVPQTAGKFNPALGTTISPRNPFAVTVVPPVNATQSADLQNNLYADQHGMLDFVARRNPAQATLLRSIPAAANPLGVHEPTAVTLFNDTASNHRHPFTDLYPIARLQKLVSERSNFFAVYTTVGLFEYDQSTGGIGKEYGSDSGDNRRLKAFYLIDRSIPVGFRVGEDHNTQNTILVRRILSE